MPAPIGDRSVRCARHCGHSRHGSTRQGGRLSNHSKLESRLVADVRSVASGVCPLVPAVPTERGVAHAMPRCHKADCCRSGISCGASFAVGVPVGRCAPVDPSSRVATRPNPVHLCIRSYSGLTGKISSHACDSSSKRDLPGPYAGGGKSHVAIVNACCSRFLVAVAPKVARPCVRGGSSVSAWRNVSDSPLAAAARAFICNALPRAISVTASACVRGPAG